MEVLLVLIANITSYSLSFDSKRRKRYTETWFPELKLDI